MTLLGGARDTGHYEGAGVAIDWVRERIKITRDGKRVVDRAVPAKWRGGSYYNKLEDITCKNPDFLGGAYARPDVTLVVVNVSYDGNDSCWAPSPELHVVAW